MKLLLFFAIAVRIDKCFSLASAILVTRLIKSKLVLGQTGLLEDIIIIHLIVFA